MTVTMKGVKRNGIMRLRKSVGDGIEPLRQGEKV